MAVSKKSIANLRPAKKGEIRNPKGAGAHKKKLPTHLQELCIEDLKEVGKLILKQDVPALNAIIREKKASVLKVWTATIAIKAIQKGDYGAWNALLDRFIGKVPTRIVDKDGGNLALSSLQPQVVVMLPPKDKIEE